MNFPSPGKTLLWRLASVLGVSITISVSISALVIMNTMPTVSADISRRVAEFQTNLIVTSFRERINTANWFHIGRDLALLNKNSNGLIRIHIHNHFDSTFIPPLPEGFQEHALLQQLRHCMVDEQGCSKVVSIQDSQGKSYLASFDFHRGFANDKIAVISILDSSIFANVEKYILGILVALSLFLFILQAGAFSWATERWIVRPIRRITKILRKDAVSELKETISATHEIAVLETKIVEYFDAMKHEQERNISLERDAAIVRITQNIAHDLRSPLGTFERLLHTDDKELPNMKPAIRESLFRLHAMIESLRYTDLDVMVRCVPTVLEFKVGLDGLQAKAINRGIELIVPSFRTLEVLIDPMKFERAWVNLVSNAIEVSHSQVCMEIETQKADLYLRIIDDGPGVPDEFLPRLFQRGATHGKVDGTGLGLAYVRQIMHGHGGDVTYRRLNSLTIFECRLPNAVVQEEEQVVKNAAFLEVKLEQRLVRTVAICVEPKTLSQSILAKLASYKSGDFFFTGEREEANIVVSNIESVMFEVLERDDQEFVGVANLKSDERAIVTILTRKFNLEPEGTIRV